MRILLTGASSFTGLWFARALAEAGHQVTAPMRGEPARYGQNDLRGRRVAALAAHASVVFACDFGGDRFVELAAAGPWDLLCHHAAEVGDYRSPDFDVAGALAANTRGLPLVLRTLQAQGLRGMMLTGSVFEQDEGAGTRPLRAFSAYGLSKGLTATVVAHRCDEAGIPLTRFVIANPFGPLEEARFCSYLVGSWRRGERPLVRTPFYVRDNIHVDLLAGCYRAVVERMADRAGPAHVAPSQYVETQGAFAQRFAVALGARWGCECPVDLAPAHAFDEPAVRINTDPAVQLCPGWDEGAAWDGAAAFYFSS